MKISDFIELLERFIKGAIESGEKENIHRACLLLNRLSGAIDGMQNALIKADKDAVSEYYQDRPSMPSRLYCDKRLNNASISLADELRLGSKYKGLLGDPKSRSNAMLGDTAFNAVYMLVNFLRQLEESVALEFLDEQLGSAKTNLSDNGWRNLVRDIYSLETIKKDNITLWTNTLFRFCIVSHDLSASDSNDVPEAPLQFATFTLLILSKPYMEARLKSRKKDRKVGLDKTFPDGVMYDENKDFHAQEAVYFTKYLHQKGKIEQMGFDKDCIQYGLKRIIREKLKKLI